MASGFDGYRLSRRAENDLADIYAYTTQHWSVDQANRYLTEIHAAVTGLVDGTKVGHTRSDIALGYLSYRVGAHAIFYRTTEHILVARVLHGSMDTAPQLALR